MKKAEKASTPVEAPKESKKVKKESKLGSKRKLREVTSDDDKEV